MSKHTPGPWKVYTPIDLDTSTYGIDSDDGEAVVFYGNTKTDGIQKIANARLIAAAPELLEAVCNLSQIVYTQNGNLHDDINKLLSQARAAIAKAKGQACE